MERMFNKKIKSTQPGDGAASSPFASLTAGLMARKGEAAPAPAHLDGVSIHSHGVAREPQSVAEQSLSQIVREALFPGGAAAAAQAMEEHLRALSSSASFSGSDTPSQPLFGKVPAQARDLPEGERPEDLELTPVPEEVLLKRANRKATVSTGDCCALPMPRAVTEKLPEGPYAKVSTRLDRERVRKLKILAARMETTNQKVMLAALDHYLDYACDVLASECPCLARSLNEKL